MTWQRPKVLGRKKLSRDIYIFRRSRKLPGFLLDDILSSSDVIILNHYLFHIWRRHAGVQGGAKKAFQLVIG